VLVLGLTDKKDASAVLEPLAEVASEVVFTRSRYRGADPRGLEEAWQGLATKTPGSIVEGPREAMLHAVGSAGEGGAVVVTGSTFVVDEALNPEAEVLEANALYVPPGEVQ
jgi:folylpolyglutamate synthase/dihydropteroate synthase